MGEYLCIGDYVCLYCEETEGYVYSSQSRYSNIFFLIIASLFPFLCMFKFSLLNVLKRYIFNLLRMQHAVMPILSFWGSKQNCCNVVQVSIYYTFCVSKTNITFDEDYRHILSSVMELYILLGNFIFIEKIPLINLTDKNLHLICNIIDWINLWKERIIERRINI